MIKISSSFGLLHSLISTFWLSSWTSFCFHFFLKSLSFFSLNLREINKRNYSSNFNKFILVKSSLVVLNYKFLKFKKESRDLICFYTKGQNNVKHLQKLLSNIFWIFISRNQNLNFLHFVIVFLKFLHFQACWISFELFKKYFTFQKSNITQLINLLFLYSGDHHDKLSNTHLKKFSFLYLKHFSYFKFHFLFVLT